jgi:hypothetical protein
VRAVRLAGPAAPPRLRLAARRALWGLVGLAAPDGEVAWSGRGQDQAWTLAAALYAGAAGSALFADTDAVLAARLRRLADVELVALAGRLRSGALQVLPSGNDALAGLDHYYSAVGSTGLAATFLELARDELPDAGAPRLALPSELDRATFADPLRTGLLARRSGRSWRVPRPSGAPQAGALAHHRVTWRGGAGARLPARRHPGHDRMAAASGDARARGALPVPRRLPAAPVHAPTHTPAVHGLRQRAPAELAAVRLSVPCRRPWVTLRWTGGALAGG